MAVSTPVVNAPNLFVDGLKLTWLTGTTVQVAAGSARNSSNQNDILLPAAVTINTAANGANGLDIGTIANSTLYALYVIADSFSSVPAAAILSTSATQPLLPSGYNMYRRIGYVLTSGAAAVLEFRQVGNNSERWMWYDVGIAELSAGASATYASVNLATSVPLSATMVLFDTILTPTGAADLVHIKPTGATGADGYAILSGPVAGAVMRAQLVVPCNATPSVDYKVTGTVTLNTKAYLDLL